MTREQMIDYSERAVATAIQAGIASYLVQAGWKSALAAGIGAGLAVVKAASKQVLSKKGADQ